MERKDELDVIIPQLKKRIKDVAMSLNDTSIDPAYNVHGLTKTVAMTKALGEGVADLQGYLDEYEALKKAEKEKQLEHA